MNLRRFVNAFSATIAVLRFSDKKLTTLVNIVRGRSTHCRITTKNSAFEATLNDSNILLVPKLIALEKRKLFKIEKLLGTQLYFNCNSRVVKARPDDLISFLNRVTKGQELLENISDPVHLKSELLRLMENGVVKLQQEEGDSYFCYIPKLELGFFGSLDQIEQVAVEMTSGYYYNGISFENKVILDIGGYIGDSALYFISMKAKSVYAYEPSFESYQTMKKNLEGIPDVHIYNVGIGCKDEEACLSGDLFTTHVSRSLQVKREVAKIRKFNDIINEVLVKRRRN